MSTYRDLTIHQRINAKGNKVSFSQKIEGLRGDLLKRIVTHFNMGAYLPEWPHYAIQFKTNHYDPTPYETKY